jgi:hypothetical protein
MGKPYWHPDASYLVLAGRPLFVELCEIIVVWSEEFERFGYCGHGGGRGLYKGFDGFECRFVQGRVRFLEERCVRSRQPSSKQNVTSR